MTFHRRFCAICCDCTRAGCRVPGGSDQYITGWPAKIGSGRLSRVAQPGSSDADLYWLSAAVELSKRCTPSATAFSVGAVLVGADGAMLTHGYSRELDPADHAEEVALAKIGLPGQDGPVPAPELALATLYSSLEPCAARMSRPAPCADLIIASGVGRVVIAWREPPIFARGGGAVRLRTAGIAVLAVPELAAAARAVNAHLLAS
jgi:diaminohydroxyphosphoribosylaminopyrimidine deaminase/5-amino-6-(5-phosphoribosylamino)uracil reductase